ncbi:uncharacterized protein METZ01_LOCUS124033, partial [marine metagenome]
MSLHALILDDTKIQWLRKYLRSHRHLKRHYQI